MDPATREWFNHLHNKTGVSCCDESDGLRIDDVDYRQNPDGSYEIHLPADGDLPERWAHVDAEHVINPPDRKVDYAIVWPYHFVPPDPKGNSVYCFMPGYGA